MPAFASMTEEETGPLPGRLSEDLPRHIVSDGTSMPRRLFKKPVFLTHPPRRAKARRFP